MPHKQLESFSLLLEERVFGYDLLRLVFLEEPSRDLIKIIAENQLIAGFPFIEDDQRIADGCHEISEYLDGIADAVDQHGSAAQWYEKLVWDYTKMFIGPNELLAPPWESTYCSKERLLFQETTLQVRKAYLRHNVIPKNYPNEADDHIGLELDFMHYITKKSLEALEMNDLACVNSLLTEQQDFLEQHLQLWVPEFADKVITHADSGFYRGMGRVLEGFIATDYLVIKELKAALSIEDM